MPPVLLLRVPTCLQCGSGKSALVDALSWVLGGGDARARGSDVVNEIVRSGGGVATAEVWFQGTGTVLASAQRCPACIH